MSEVLALNAADLGLSSDTHDSIYDFIPYMTPYSIYDSILPPYMTPYLSSLNIKPRLRTASVALPNT